MGTPLVRRSAAPAPEPKAVDEIRTRFDGVQLGSPTSLSSVRAALQRAEPLEDPEYKRLAARIKIDRNNLDAAAIEQSEVFLDICEHHALSISKRDAAKEALSTVDAEVARDKRIDCTKKGEKQPTKDAMDEYVVLHERHTNAQAALANAQREERRWGILRDSFDQRMRMIRELVGLYASGYWTNSGTAVARGSVEQATAERRREEMAKAREQKQ